MASTDRSPAEGENPARSFRLSLAIGSLLLTAVIYGILIWSNCEAEGMTSFLGDVRRFHTAEGC